MKLPKSVVAALLVVSSFAANATLIDFESASLGASNLYSQDGFTLVDNLVTSTVNTAIQTSSVPGNTSQVFAFCAIDGFCTEDTYLTLTGGIFSLNSIDAANWNIQNTTGSLDLVGYFQGGGSITQTLTTTDVWQTWVLSGFSNLVSVDIIGYTSYAFSIDNLVVNTSSEVPVPASLSLLAFGLALLGFRRKSLVSK